MTCIGVQNKKITDVPFIPHTRLPIQCDNGEEKIPIFVLEDGGGGVK
jgi:hypothetical protein